MSARRLVFNGVLILLIATIGFYALTQPTEVDRCDRYQLADQPLIAHAGGGLPTAVYTNSLPALELAAGHNFKLIELDFFMTNKGIAIGHDAARRSPMSLDQLLAFLRRHPGISIVTDFKTDNLTGLRELAQQAGPMKSRFIPQIYALDQFEPVVKSGFQAPILTVYRIANLGWISGANKIGVRAVTLPFYLRHLAHFIDHPVYLNTANEPTPGYGLYTDCLIPARAA